MMKKILFTFLYTCSLVFAGEITIAVAANVSYAIEPLIKTFNETNPEIKVNVILGSSGKLLAQITHGAPYELFMSANMKYPNRLYEQNLTKSKPIVYAQGSLAIFSSRPYDYTKGFAVLEEENIKKIAIANPQTAPYGVAAREALQNVKLYAKLEKKFVYGESISQTVIYAKSAADIGIISKSSLYASQMLAYKENVHWLDVDASLYTPIDQGMVILKHGKDNAEVKAFYDFILGKQAKEILNAFGYKVL